MVSVCLHINMYMKRIISKVSNKIFIFVESDFPTIVLCIMF